MADGKYYGRGDETNRPLSHAEVLRIHNQHAQQQDIIQATHHEMEKFPHGTSKRWPMMVVLAQPLGPPARMLKTLSAAVGQLHTEVNAMLREAGVESQRSFDPNFVSTSGRAVCPRTRVAVGHWAAVESCPIHFGPSIWLQPDARA